MGLLLSRSSASELELPRALQDACVSEHDARSSGPLRVLGCTRCQRRLCVLGREGQGATAVWKAPVSRLETAWLGGGRSFRCRMCGLGKVTVEVAEANGVDAERSGGDEPLPLRVVLKGSNARNAFRPFCVHVCGMYDSVVARAASLFQADAIRNTRSLNVSQRTFKRSELAKLAEADLPQAPMELLVIAHRISGQRNPLTDQHGLYNNLLKHAWTRADVVILCLFDVPVDYFSQLLNEQPTLRGLLTAGRLLPIFTLEESPSEEASCAIDAEARGDAAIEPSVGAETAWWFVRCLDGQVPRYDGLPPDNGNIASVQATLTKVVAEVKEARLEKESRSDLRRTREAADVKDAASCTVAVLAHVAQDFADQPLLRD